MADKKNNTSMNKELREWINETKQEIKNKREENKEDFTKRKPEGKCEICGEKAAEAVCIKCGKNVCKGCYFKLIGVCP